MISVSSAIPSSACVRAQSLNALLSADRQWLKLADFGLAKMKETTMSRMTSKGANRTATESAAGTIR